VRRSRPSGWSPGVAWHGVEPFGRDPIGLDELNDLGEPHGIRFLNDLVPPLKAASNVRLIGG
jgi:hypothetical protein